MLTALLSALLAYNKQYIVEKGSTRKEIIGGKKKGKQFEAYKQSLKIYSILNAAISMNSTSFSRLFPYSVVKRFVFAFGPLQPLPSTL